MHRKTERHEHTSRENGITVSFFHCVLLLLITGTYSQRDTPIEESLSSRRIIAQNVYCSRNIYFQFNKVRSGFGILALTKSRE